MTGQRFGKLTVLRRAVDCDKWVCLCDCGREIKVNRQYLIKGVTTQCRGCRFKHSTIDILPQQKYGRLTTLYPVDKSVIQEIPKSWMCECECGNIVEINSSRLASGNTRSCGCLHYEAVSQTIKEYNNNKGFTPNSYIQLDEFTIAGIINDKTFIFDYIFYPLLRKYKWFLDSDGYVKTHIPLNDKTIYLVNEKCRTVAMHQILLDTIYNGYVADHINGDILDNRFCNLRLVTQRQNVVNSRVKNKYGYRGIVLSGSRYMALARRKDDKKKEYLGMYTTAEEAARAYDKYVFDRDGWFAKLNFPNEYKELIEKQHYEYYSWLEENADTLSNNLIIKDMWHKIIASIQQERNVNYD